MNENKPAAVDGLVTQLHARTLAAEAEEAANGFLWLTVWHGDLESDDDMQRVQALSDAAWSWADRWPGCVCTQGGNDYWAVRIGPPAPDPADLLADLETLAAELAPTSPATGRTWWRIHRGRP
ncbi:hypothetical protein GCM10012275_61660 [Longimycelium tulufanense]|uniref:Uncharacterized protein n=1 Tax=Longimycelium tulufanense TaxID=907463 RepID=A0A8J3CIU6_9PSEU|nr:hypothetical protein [Longimycelium tulufanense]GGM82816.1 hypothetical protein GCM10012275_61660 [Longimycelium tulufanense]